MPARKDIQHILMIGAGPIVIGQACEFDYSGTQAVRTLRQLGYRVTLVNSNPATIMTDPSIADETFIEPITVDVITRIIEQTRPDALLPTMGGQTALNVSVELHHAGVLDRLGVEMIGADAEVIDRAENRARFQSVARDVGLETPRSFLVGTVSEAQSAMHQLSFPVVLRPSYTLGGAGGGIVYNEPDFERMLGQALFLSPISQVLLEESVIGWKECEIEVVCDRVGNCIVVCAIENIDPMGVHTGDSITVSPILTLTDKEYQRMRNAAFAVVRAIGVRTGGCNVQFAVHPETGRMVVIEVNPRVSRSSALASKATGFPIAKVAAQLAVDMTLDEIKNDITATTPASFEPTLDYVAVKIPRFDFNKFRGVSRTLTTSMKAVGESLAVARSFPEALQKALCSMETGLDGLTEPPDAEQITDPDAIRARVAQPSDTRLLWIAEAFRRGLSVEDIHRCSKIDPWFLREIDRLVKHEDHLKKKGLPESQDRSSWWAIKRDGFSDSRIATLTATSEADVAQTRERAGVKPVFKCIDTCAAEFPSSTPYLYSTFEGESFAPKAVSDAPPSSHLEKIVVLGGGPNRIGTGLEFDYCCVHAIEKFRDLGCETVMINCNPETVSTDYDTANRLYLEPLTFERVLEILRFESERGKIRGVVVQFGGQTPLKLCKQIQASGFPIIGTSPDSIDLAEDRGRFKSVLERSNIPQPASTTACSPEESQSKALELGLPILIRPSYVLAGRAMTVVSRHCDVVPSFNAAWALCAPNPVLIDTFLHEAIEVDVDAVSDGTNVMICGIIEHVEQAGIHSGDSAGVLPCVSLSPTILQEIERITTLLAQELSVVGLLNIQFAVKSDTVFVLEANPRASRTAPFVAKATGIPLVKIAAAAMLGHPLPMTKMKAQLESSLRCFAVKEVVFPFVKLGCEDALLGPEMQSTGEVMGLHETYAGAFAKAQIAAGATPPIGGVAFLSVCDDDKPAVLAVANSLLGSGFKLMATEGTASFLNEHGIQEVQMVRKVSQGSPHCVDSILSGQVDLVINTTSQQQSIADSASIRMGSLRMDIPYSTTIAGAVLMTQAIQILQSGSVAPLSLQHYHGGSPFSDIEMFDHE